MYYKLLYCRIIVIIAIIIKFFGLSGLLFIIIIDVIIIGVANAH